MATLLLTAAGHAAISLNELDSSTLQNAPTTEGFQFVELKGLPGESLDGYSLAFFNGSNDVLYRVVSLDGFAIGASGYFVVGNPGVPAVNLVLPALAATSGSNTPPADDTIQPGPDGVALYHQASNAYVPSSFMTAGAPPVPKGVVSVNAAPGETRVDALLYTSFNSAEDVDLKAALGVPAQYDENANGLRLTQSLNKSGGAWIALEPSPGRDNFTGFPTGGKLFLELSDADLSAAEGDAPIAARIKLLNAAGAPLAAPAGGITVAVRTTDFSEGALMPGPVAVVGSEVATLSVTIPAAATQSAEFFVRPQDDGWLDGTQTAFLTAEPAAGADIGSHSCWLNVTDAGADVAFSVVVNEVHGHSVAAGQFVEFVNAGGSDVDLSGFRLTRNETTLLTLPACLTLRSGQALLIMGDPAAVQGITAAYNNALVFGASPGLTNGSAVRLLNGAGTELAGHVFNALEGGSNSRKADATGTVDGRYGNQWLQVPATGPGSYDAPYYFGTIAPGSFGYRYDAARPLSTPGTQGDGTTAFLPITGAHVLTFTDTFSNTANAVSVPELWGKGAAKLTIARPAGAPNTSSVCVRIERSNSNGGASAPTLTTDLAGLLPDMGNSVTIPSGLNSVDVFLHTTDTTAGNGDNTFTVSARSSFYLNSTQSIVIRDSSAALLSLKCTSVVESAAAGSSALNIAGGVGSSAYLVRSEPVGAVALAAQVPAASSTGSLAAGGTAVLPVDSLNDLFVLDRQVRLTYLSGPAGDSRNGNIILNVVDDGGIIELGPFINEADTLQGAPDVDDFVELTAPGGAGKSLSGFIAVVYGPAGTVVSTHSLTASSFRAASNFFVLSNAAPSGPGRLNTTSSNWLPVSGAVAVYRGAPADYPVGSAINCNNLIDALVFNAANAALTSMLTPGMSHENESGCVIARNPDASLASHLRNSATYDGTVMHRTPGFSNTGSLSGYSAYVEAFPAAAVQAAASDTDGDGIGNLVEYFMGTNPTIANSIPLPVIAAGIATLTIDRSFASSCDPHVSLIAEKSPNLLTWTPMTSAGVDPVVFTTPAAGPVLFVRLKATVVP